MCERVYPEHRARCPNCGTENSQPSVAGGKKSGLFSTPERIAAVYLVVAVLAGLNIWQATIRSSGPDPEQEALHSPQEALQECRVALRSQLSEQHPEVVGPLEVHYLQGGEYEVAATVDLRGGSRRVQRQALCELQFAPEDGWTVRPIDLSGGWPTSSVARGLARHPSDSRNGNSAAIPRA